MPSYIQRPDRTWSIRWSETHPETGLRNQPIKSGFSSEEDAQRWWKSREILEFIDEPSQDVVNHVVREYLEVSLQRLISETFSREIAEVLTVQMEDWRTSPYTGIENAYLLDSLVAQWRENPEKYDQDSEIGAVYFFQGADTKLIKIGASTKAGTSRRLLTLQSASPDRLKVIRILPGGQSVEALLHRVFDTFRSHNEWFFPGLPLVSFIDETFDLDIRLIDHAENILARKSRAVHRRRT